MRRITAIVIGAVLAGLTFAGGPAAEAGGGCHNGVFSDEENVQVEMSKNCFEPTVVRVQPGQQVTWTSNDLEEHAVTGAANSWGGEGKIHTGESVTYQFDESGVFPYFCFFHPSMVGAVVVGDGSPAVSGAAANDGVKAVSAEVPGGQSSDTQAAPEVVEEDADGDNIVPIAIGVGTLAALAGFAAALIVRRKPVSS